MITAKLRHLRISPRKVRLVADLVKGLSVTEAERQLRFSSQRAARPILKLLNSAVANAKDRANFAKENLYLAKIIVDMGPTLKRWRARAMGRAAPIMKRTSHITLFLEQKEEVAPVEQKPIKKAALEPKKIEESRPIEEKDEPAAKPKAVPPARPYPTTPRAKKRFFSRQTFGNVKKFFRRKSI